MFKIKREYGLWTVQLVSNARTVFKSLSKGTCQEWRKINEPLPAADQLNATIGANVWRNRD